MRNIKAEIKGGKLLIEVDVSKQTLEQAPLSTTKKTKLVATSNGNLPVGSDGLKIGLNVMAPVA